MRVLFLEREDSPLIPFLRNAGEEVICTMDKIDLPFVKIVSPDFIVSYGYRHIISKDVVELYLDRTVNLHISMLLWNKGCDPNLWSFIENTPKGVSIHFVDEGIDTGDIIAQKEVSFSPADTLRTSYEKLQREIQQLFAEHWEAIKSGRYRRRKQEGEGSFHSAKDKESVAFLLRDGYDTPVSVLEEYGTRHRHR